MSLLHSARINRYERYAYSRMCSSGFRLNRPFAFRYQMHHQGCVDRAASGRLSSVPKEVFGLPTRRRISASIACAKPRASLSPCSARRRHSCARKQLAIGELAKIGHRLILSKRPVPIDASVPQARGEMATEALDASDAQHVTRPRTSCPSAATSQLCDSACPPDPSSPRSERHVGLAVVEIVREELLDQGPAPLF